MKRIAITGVGAVSPAGWGVPALLQSLESQRPLPETLVERPGWPKPLRARQVQAPIARPAFLAHPRLRRSSPIAQFTAAAALEALGQTGPNYAWTGGRLGLIYVTMCGGIRYTRRFYAEALADPAQASPLLFPETVFNAPASHVAALLNTPAPAYSLVGDAGAYLQALALAADWLCRGQVEVCLVIGAEEIDWTIADAWRLFARHAPIAEGAAALRLELMPPSGSGAPELAGVTSPQLLLPGRPAADAAAAFRSELPAGAADELLCDSRQGIKLLDAPEEAAWAVWPGAKLSPKRLLGEGFAASAAWQCAVAAELLRQRKHRAACISVVGANQQAIGAHFVAPDSTA